MFGWLTGRKRLPLNGSRRAEIELRLRLIVERLSIDRLKQIEVVSDVRPFCPGAITEFEQAEAVKQRVADRMMIDANDVTLKLDGLEHQAAAVQYVLEDRQILLRPDLLSDPTRLVVVLAHELSRDVLLNDDDDKRIPMDDEWLPELYAICSGFSLLTANATIRTASSSQANWSYWQSSRLGYLASSDVGYACALLAKLRSETDPPWASLLRADAATVFRKAMRALPEIGTMLVGASAIPGSDSSLPEIENFLSDDQASFRYAAVRALALRDERSPGLVPAIINLLGSRDEAMVTTAAYVLGSMGSEAVDSLPAMEALLTKIADPVACSAAEAMVEIAPSEETYSIAGEMLENRWATSSRLATTLSRHGQAAKEVAPHICRRLVVALRDAADSDVESLTACLYSVHPEPVSVLETVISNQEVLEWVTDYLRELDANRP